MLPTKGYFQDIDCPYYDSSCGRPYCHFRHKKKQHDPGNDSPKETDIPTYKPTPKSQLVNNRSHIPISYVPDLAFRPERTRNVQKFIHDRPIYKPTPLSVLSSVKKQDNAVVSDDTEKLTEDETIQGKEIQKSQHEYDPSDNINISIHYTPTSESNKLSQEHSENEYKPSGEISEIEYKPTSNNDDNIERADTHYLPKSDNPTNIEYHPTPQLDNDCTASIDFEDLDNEFNMIDEIISDNSTNLTTEQENTDEVETEKTNESKPRSSESRKEKHHSRPKERDKLEKDGVKKDHKEDEKKSDKDKKSESHKKVRESDKTSEKSKHSKSESKKETSKHSRDSKHKKQTQKEPSRKEKSKHSNEKHESRSKSSSSKHKSHVREKDKNEKQREKKHSSKDLERSDKHHHIEKSKKSIKERSDTRNREEKHKNKKTDDKHSNKKRSKSESEKSDTSNGNNANIDIVEFELDSEDEDTMDECYRIFNEYKAPETAVEKPVQQQQEPIEDEAFKGKKRVAHINAEKVTPKIQAAPPNSVPSAAQIMTNRFKAARAAQASNEQTSIMEEVKQLSLKRELKRPAPPSLVAAMKKYKIQKTIKEAQLTNKPSSSSVVDDILSGTQKTNHAVAKFGQRKIAPVSNIGLLQKAKQRIDEMKQKAVESDKKTTAQIVKGKRVAHVPEFSLADIPDVLQADKSKLPVNVRTRFLTMIAEECGKLYLTKEDAYTRALNEEFACYEKCKVLITYKNSAMLAVNRIRKEHQERTKQGLGPLYLQDESNSQKCSDFLGRKFHDNVKRYLLTNEELDIHGYPKESKVPGRAVIKNRKIVTSMPLVEYQRKCARCSKIYVVDEDGFAFYEEECLYHPLKKRTFRGEQTYLCCKSNEDSGCCTSHTHVSECTDDTDLEGYQVTMEPESDSDLRSIGVYALDCEMCYTTKGLELTRVTIVDADCKTVYDSLVKPLNPIIDYNTRFSGITKEQMDKTSTSILQVQANILHLCNSETILIGHSLESDMKALKIIHANIIDTSVLLPHRLGLPHKRALRALASEYLKKIIQNDISGHDSAEDAITCMELVKWKLKEELKVHGIK